jgi:PEP-CTERM motif
VGFEQLLKPLRHEVAGTPNIEDRFLPQVAKRFALLQLVLQLPHLQNYTAPQKAALAAARNVHTDGSAGRNIRTCARPRFPAVLMSSGQSDQWKVWLLGAPSKPARRDPKGIAYKAFPRITSKVNVESRRGREASWGLGMRIDRQAYLNMWCVSCRPAPHSKLALGFPPSWNLTYAQIGHGFQLRKRTPGGGLMRLKSKNIKKLASLSAVGAGALVFGAHEAEAGIIYSGPVNAKVGFDSGFGPSYLSPALPSGLEQFRFSTNMYNSLTVGGHRRYHQRINAVGVPLVDILGGVRMRLLAVLLFAASLSASPITISGNGTFSASTPTSTFSAPSETWSFSFTLDSQLAVSSILAGSYFSTTAFSGFTYFLNGSPDAITPDHLTFFRSGDGGMFNICVSAGCDNGFYFQGPQMYTGSESTPTILTGPFTSTALYLGVNSVSTTEANTTVQAVGSGVPEPSTFLALGTGLLVLAGRRLYRRTYRTFGTGINKGKKKTT